MAVDRLAQLAVDIVINARRARTQLANFQRQIGANATAVRGLSTTIGAIGLGASGFLLLRKVAREFTEAIRAAFEASVEFQSNILRIEKIALTGNIQELANQFVAVSEAVGGIRLNDVAEGFRAAARAGVGLNDGLSNLARAGLELKLTSEDIGVVEATEGLARLKKNLDFEGDVLNLKSAIDALSSSFVITSGEILKTSQRLSGIAGDIGITTAELLGFTTAVLETGATATTVRSTFVKLFTTLGAEAEKAARAIGLIGDDVFRFAALVETDANAAVLKFLELFRELDTTQQRRALEELGLASVRVSSVISLAAGAIDEIRKGQQQATVELEIGADRLDRLAVASLEYKNRLTDLTNEFDLFKASLLDGSKIISILDGTLTNLKANLGDRPVFGLADFVGGDIEKTRQNLKGIEIILDTLKNQRNALLRESGTNVGLRDIAGLFTGETPGTIIQVQKLTGEIQKFEKLREITREKLEKQGEANVKLAEKEAELSEKINKLEEERNKIFEERKRAAGQAFLQEQATRGAGTGFGIRDLSKSRFQLDLERNFNALQDVFNKIIDTFGSLENATEAVREEFELAREITEKNRRFILEEEAKERRLKIERKEQERLRELTALEGVTGKFGEALGVFRNFDELLSSGFIKANAALSDNLIELAVAQFDKLLNSEKKQSRFIGLTEAWKQAQIATQKENPLEKKQLEIAQKVLEQHKTSNTTLKSILREKIKIK